MLFNEIINHSLDLQKAEVRLFPIADSVRWSRFIVKLQGNRSQEGRQLIPEPFDAVKKLAEKYLQKGGNPILDIGCETGKNAACLIESGHRVVLLDVAPKAIQYTLENLKRRRLSHGVTDYVVEKIESLDPRLGPFKAVVGTYVFSHIFPDLFEEVMRERVFEKIEPGGFFAGGFFGEEHCCNRYSDMTFLTAEKIREFFSSEGFTICEIVEKIEMHRTSRLLQERFHTIEVVARRSFS